MCCIFTIFNKLMNVWKLFCWFVPKLGLSQECYKRKFSLEVTKPDTDDIKGVNKSKKVECSVLAKMGKNVCKS